MRIFLFGSAMSSETPHDIDILITYAGAEPPQAALQFRREFKSRLEKYVSLPLHIILLSESEEIQTQFISREHGRPLTRGDVRRFQRFKR